LKEALPKRRKSRSDPDYACARNCRSTTVKPRALAIRKQCRLNVGDWRNIDLTYDRYTSGIVRFGGSVTLRAGLASAGTYTRTTSVLERLVAGHIFVGATAGTARTVLARYGATASPIVPIQLAITSDETILATLKLAGMSVITHARFSG